MAKSFPTLYKKTSTGAIQSWKISVDGNTIITVYGQVDGKQQRTEDTIENGKNIGKSNETSPEEQAFSEATSKWEGKIKKGYVDDIARAEIGDNDIKGGYDCMLAHKFVDHGHKIVYPAFIQPKLNGHRCVAVIENGVATLWSRTRKPILSCPHIIAELERVYSTGFHMKDGELYNHKYKDRFEDLASLIRQEVPDPKHTEIEYHMYDNPSDDGFNKRIERLITELHCYEKKHALLNYLKVVETLPVKDEEEMMDAFEHFIKKGYEGGMARNAEGKYLGKRSYDLQKIKEFLDDDFEIVGIKEGRGGYKGCGIFICDAKNGMPAPDNTFDVKMRGPKERLMEFLEKPKLWKDKTLVVKYQYISKYGIPIFPVGERFKEDE